MEDGAELEAGCLIASKYRLVRRLGAGAMGAVWEVEHELTEKHLALKLVSPELASDRQYHERMLREARAAGRIEHPNVVEIYDVGETREGRPFLVMELLRGESLEDLLDRSGALPAEHAVAIATQVAAGLAAAHTAGVVHRDLKPANIFLHQHHGNTVVKVVDFGVSKLLSHERATSSVTGLAIGSPAYMSPEQARGERDIDHRCDIWALGVVLFESLTGQRPFSGETAYDVVAEVLKGDIPRARSVNGSVSEHLDGIVAACLQRNRDARPASAMEVLRWLDPTGAIVARRDSRRETPSLAPPRPSASSTVGARSATGATTTTPASQTQPLQSQQGRSFRALLASAGVVALLGVAGAAALVASGGPATSATPLPSRDGGLDIANTGTVDAPVDVDVGDVRDAAVDEPMDAPNPPKDGGRSPRYIRKCALVPHYANGIKTYKQKCWRVPRQ